MPIEITSLVVVMLLGPIVLFDLVLGGTGFLTYSFGTANAGFVLFFTAGVGAVFYTIVLAGIVALVRQNRHRGRRSST